MNENPSLAPNLGALQHKYGPRPLPLFLDLVARECAGDMTRIAAVMAGLRKFESTPRQTPRLTAPVAARSGRVQLRDLGGTGPPLVFVPSLINPPYVLDLAHGHSLTEWMKACGFHVFLIDWGSPEPDERALDVGDHVSQHLLPLLRTFAEPPLLAGYCLGGTMALAAAVLLPVRALALIATPWNFDGFPAPARDDQARLWAAAAASADTLGLMPMEMLQSGFWQLDPARTVRKYADFGRLTADRDDYRLFVAVEDWANDGPPLTYAAARQLFEAFLGRNETGRGEWRINGQTILPSALTCPVIDIVSTVDRIVPSASASGVANRQTLNLGHVGMIVSRQAPKRLWQPLADFMSNAVRSATQGQ